MRSSPSIRSPRGHPMPGRRGAYSGSFATSSSERLAERLFKRRVRAHGCQQLAGRHAVGNGLTELADHIGRMLAHELRAEQHAGLRVGDDLHKAAAGACDHGAGVGKKRALADLDRDVAHLGIGLGQADGGDLRAAIDAAGDEVQPDARRAARKPLHASRSLRRRDVGQLHRGRNIADGIDAGNARLPVFIRMDAAAVRLRLEAVCEQALPVRAAAEGREHGLARDEVLLAAGGKVDGQTVPRPARRAGPWSWQTRARPAS